MAVLDADVLKAHELLMASAHQRDRFLTCR